ncbi:MAG: hypothetical protein ACYC45_02630 [Acidithiobacillus ferriphilus]|uniref:hypothetical protein n=1 Tax=Acidithiobacillus ferriphilus TaxID=1689834 RepID=UPI001C05F987|nr:hypothetical protein [Acidithiobacillus ferriphilus]MBU2784526.1 hypothetical protein [Acidithiobacillus ferriphilus]MBU2846154.1 hypothetical protein [Acidithiobacillus ferriphilus]MBU2848739.1 hypothetical protein [Acidithiobacillus ferriphilus]UEP58989.1 hypothetical protein K1Y48_11985 [Acidithiobacillus ferriphilus]
MNRRRFMSAMAALAGTMGLPLPSAASTVGFAAIPKSLWVWKTPLIDIYKVADFSERYGFNTIFYSVPPTDRGSLPTLQSALLLLKERGISAYIVGGTPTWAQDQNPPSSFQSLLNLAGQGANGICLDVEPQDSAAWKTSQDHQAIGMDYLNFLQNAVTLAQSNGLPTCVSTVPAFNNLPISHNGTNILGAVASIVQAQVLMAYRSNPGAALRIAARSLETIAAVNGKFWFGVTTKIGAPSAISYAGSTAGNFHQAMITMDAALQNKPGYLGIAINDYQSLRTLLGV